MPSSGIKVVFSVEYRTNYGEQLYVCGQGQEIGDWDPNKAIKLSPNEDFSIWSESVEMKILNDFEFKFLVKNDNGESKWEDQQNRTFKISDLKSLRGFSTLYLRCFWQSPLSSSEVLQEKTSAFKDCIFSKRPTSSGSMSPSTFILQFVVKVLRVKPDSEVVVYGTLASLGNGDPLKGIKLIPIEGTSFWGTHISSGELKTFKYNYAIVDSNKRVVKETDSRTFTLPQTYTEENSPTFLKTFDFPFMYPGSSNWKGAGVSVPVFSLRTESSCGVGDFLDLKKMVDWVSACGFRMLQILPINDTRIFGSWKDSYPYSPLSAFALHPLYLSLERFNLPPKLKEALRTKKAELNHHQSVDYENVLSFKLSIVSKVFEENRSEILKDKEFISFFNENKHWMEPYALFLHFQNKYKTSNFYSWPSHHCDITKEEIDRLCHSDQEHYDELLTTYFIQFHLHLQLSEATKYALDRRVFLKGDLPIGVSPLSVDCWSQRHLFRTHFSTGAPPDYFATDGQNWGFPTYNWEAMKVDNYGWWRNRLRQMAKYFQAYRIDHILGFFRIWEIPAGHVQGLLGRFQPSIPLTSSELESYGLWDFQRYCEPYIRDYHIKHISTEIVKHFLEEYKTGCWRFKSQFKTEGAIQKELDVGDEGSEFMKELSNKLQSVLFNLLRNVVLIKDPEDNNKFYPRIELYKTDSYHSLDDSAKRDFYYLYNDYFFKRQDHFWSKGAMEKLPMMIDASDMMVCGEDLGMIPDCVAGVLHHLNILGLRIERMPCDPKEKVSDVQQYPYMTVCTPSVHDTSNLRAWWEEDPELRQYYYNNVLGQTGEAPTFCEPWIVRKIIENHLYSPSMWAVFTVQDLFGMFQTYRVKDPKSETINIPAVRYHYWRYRINVNLETLVSDTEMTNTLHSMLQHSQRVFDY